MGKQHEPLAIYFFKNPTLSHDNIVSLACSSSIGTCEDELFISGFYKALDICKHKINVTNLLIESLGDNYKLIKYILN